MRTSPRAALAALCLVTSAPAALAQDDASPRARQEALHAQLLAAPDDPELMLAYARASAEARDYEAVIATLERALIYAPGDPAIMAELGAAYFRLGSYAAARSYLESARAAGLPPEVEASVDRYLAAIDERAARSRFEGSVAVGLAASTNANLGVEDRSIRFFGQPAIIGDSFTEQSDTGFRVLAEATHSYDLGTPRLDFWKTDAQLYSMRWFEEDEGDLASLSVTTGPHLSLDESAFGPKARPFLGLRVVRSAGDPYYVEYGGGASATDTITAEWGWFARGDVGYRDYSSDFESFDAAVFRGLAGAAYTFDAGRTVFLAGFLETERAEESFRTSIEAGARLAAVADYDPGLAFAQGLSTVSAYLQASTRSYGDPDPTVDPDRTRDDVDLAFGLTNLLRIRDGVGLQVEVEAFRRDSNIPNYDVEAVTGVLSVVYEF